MSSSPLLGNTVATFDIRFGVRKPVELHTYITETFIQQIIGNEGTIIYWSGNMKTLYIGARIGNSISDCCNYSFPFIRATFQTNHLEIECVVPILRQVAIPYNERIAIKHINGLLTNGLQILHKNINIPTIIILWYFSGSKITELIKNSFFNVTIVDHDNWTMD